MNGLCLKVIAKGEVAQHLKEGAVAGCLSDIFNIAGADALRQVVTLLLGGISCPVK